MLALYTDDGLKVLRLQPGLEERLLLFDEVKQLFHWNQLIELSDI